MSVWTAAAERFELAWEERTSPLAIDDPAGWVKRKLKNHLWSKQQEILESVRDNPRTAVKSCHSAGKSFTGSSAATWWIDAHEPGEAFVVTSAPTGDQVKAILWREINRAHKRGHLSGRMNLTEWYLGDELVAFGRKPSDTNPTAFQGIHAKYVLVILDEACGIPEALWHAADSLTSNRNGRILAIGNPDDPESHFAKVCEMPSWNTIRISAFDTPGLTGEDVPDELLDLLVSAEWVRTKAEEWGEDSPMYISKVLGDFAPDASDGTIPASWLARCRHVDLEPGDEVQAGFDVAGSEKGDWSYVWVRQGAVAVHQARVRTADPNELAEWANDIVTEWDVQTLVVDSIGVGWGMMAALNLLSCPAHIVPFNAASSADDKDKFENARAEMWWRGRDMSRLGMWDLSRVDDDTIDQLTKPRYRTKLTPGSKGKIIVESKADIRKRLGGRSTDSADALLMAFVPTFTAVSSVSSAQRRLTLR